LGYELDEGAVVFSINAQKHALKRHPNDYWACLPFIANILANPLYLGDDLNNNDRIEFVGRPPTLGTPILVAIEIKLDGNGCYNICSFYPISQGKVNDRIHKRHLKIVVRA
jgi:hypothetical protein